MGAGLNQVVHNQEGAKPPMATNLFQVASKIHKFSEAHYQNRLSNVYDYILKFWKLTEHDLTMAPFDLEECFTLLEQQLRESIDNQDNSKERLLGDISFKFVSFLAELLSDFELSVYDSEELKKLGKMIYSQRSTVITFNYDCLIEAAIEIASGVTEDIPVEFISPKSATFTREVSNDELPYSHFNWNRPLGYGVKFDRVQLHRAGISDYVDGERFYSHPRNELYPWHILKLHGSLNWFRYLPFKSFKPASSENDASFEELKNEVVLVEGHWWFTSPPELDGWYIYPLIVTPTLYKQDYFRDPIYNRVLAPMWQEASESLIDCDKLVVIGYSFPPTDFQTKKLFLEAFSNSSVEELFVVNPNTSVVQKVKELCHFHKPISVCRDLGELLQIS